MLLKLAFFRIEREARIELRRPQANLLEYNYQTKEKRLMNVVKTELENSLNRSPDNLEKSGMMNARTFITFMMVQLSWNRQAHIQWLPFKC